MQHFQRQAIPEIIRVFGHSGLFLRPAIEVPEELSGNMLAQVISLYRLNDSFAGSLLANDTELPIASESLSLVYGLCVLETSPNPDALFAELARCLKPEGVMVIGTLNSFSPTSLRWRSKGVRAMGTGKLRQLCAKHSFEINKISKVGPIWLKPQKKAPRYEEKPGLMNIFYAGQLLVAKRRVAGLTPLRKANKAYSLNPGVSPG